MCIKKCKTCSYSLIIISFVTEQSFCIARMVFEKRRTTMAVLEVKELTKKYGEGESGVTIITLKKAK